VWLEEEQGANVGAKAEPQPAGESSGARHKLEDEAEGASVPKRARCRKPRSGSLSGNA
jgi:hypothetical protein